tara:strand:- start:4398 stop:5756 length:1359 start_codon:yes stop_codon:yes gene_type:complete
MQILEAYVGLLWGDEGKAKILDEAVERAKAQNDGKRTIVIRFQGGPNAGHTMYVRRGKDMVKFVTHAAPSGIVSDSDIAIGPHVAFDPEKFKNELEEAEKLFNYKGKIFISERTGILFDYHRKLDAHRENTPKNIGTTKSGIGPFYEDTTKRLTRITFVDYVSDNFEEKLREVIKIKEKDLKEAGILTKDYIQELLDLHNPIREELKQYATRLEYKLREYLDQGNHIILEGAQGTLLDVDMGTLPMVSSSHILVPAALAQLMLPRSKFKIYGIEKVYPTRVGNGPFPTFEDNNFSKDIAKNAGEFGATTGRARKVGYPDWIAVKRSALLNDCDGIFITRIDNIQGKEIKVCTSYDFNQEFIQELPLKLENVKPVYTDKIFAWELWNGPEDLSNPEEVDKELRGKRREYIEGGFYNLPEGLKEFIHEHDNYIGVPTVGISIGPARGETVLRSP